jgi:nucleoid-associated protein YgaU
MAWGMGEIDKAKLVQVPPLSSPVYFTFNPKQVVLKRQVAAAANTSSASNLFSPPPVGSTDPVWTKTEPPVMSFTAWLEGESTKPFSDQLLNWLSPAGGLIGLIAGLAGGGESKLPTLLFQWGPPAAGFAFMCNLTACQVTYQRFTGAGIPTRAECQVTLTQVKDWLNVLGTNPTSGGLPGRQRRTVTEGENIVGITYQAYGRRTNWRAVAEANGVEDPFRVRAGDDLYLPSRQELGTNPAR